MQRSVGLRTGILVLALAGLLAYVVSAATTYADVSDRFAFTVPDGYIQHYRAGTDVSYRSVTTPTSTVDITVIAEAPDPILPADTIAMNTLKGLVPPAYTPGAAGIQPTLLGGQPARKFDYYTTLDGVPTRTHTLQIVATTARAAYLLVFSAADTDYTQMLGDTAIIPGSFSFGSAGGVAGVGSVTTGSGSVTTGSSVAAGATSTAMPMSTAAPVFAAVSGNAPATVPILPPGLAPSPIPAPMPSPSPVFTLSMPTPVTTGSSGIGPTVTAGAANATAVKGPGYGGRLAPQASSGAGRDRN